MGRIIWQIKEAVSKLIVVLVIGAVAYGGYSLYRKGAFRGGIGHTSRVILRQIPYFGSRFRHFIASGPSVASGSTSRRARNHHRRVYRHVRRHRRR